MKEINELNLPDGLRYTRDHEWVKIMGDAAIVGISDYAQDQLGDIVYVEMPEVGDEFKQGEEFGTLESVKAVSETYLPLTGEIIEINEALADAPELVNKDPYENWIVRIRPADLSELDSLLTVDEYLDLLNG
ncbi:MAG: glycine cleavage system protein GcvH [Desulfocapsaceae bacterium]|nr:glycine cleavage system protein GcvH [Desulfocapsaceae bacterium]